jgi:hypothetical protein
MGYDEELAAMQGYADKIAQPIVQGSAEWLAARVGHVTASRFKDVMDFTSKGKSGAKREAYKIEVLVERLTGSATEHYVNAAMQHGTETEPLARMAYEGTTGYMVEQVAFIRHPTIKWVGGSPDGLVGDDGGCEFKCPQAPEHIRILMSGDIDDYLPQVQGLMWITGRKWWDFMSFCPMLPDELVIYIVRVNRDEEYIAELESAVRQFLDEITVMHATLLAKVGAMHAALLAKVGAA